MTSKEHMQTLFSNGLLSDAREIKGEYRRRNATVDRQKVRHSDVDEFVEQGWIRSKKLKRDTWLERPKKHQNALEDKFWCLLFRMGYRELNSKNFRIPFKRNGGSVDSKQIDVFARDEETVLVVECKSSKTRKRRTLQNAIAETGLLKGKMARAIRNYYGQDFKPKIVWIYVTRNIIWSELDVERARSQRIIILTEAEMDYYDSYIRHVGPAGRYQVLAELLRGQSNPAMRDIRVPAVKGKVGGFAYYSFVTTPKVLLKISFVNHFALNHPDGRPAYQRMVSRHRLKRIAKFINSGGYFPTNLLVNFTQKCRFDPLSNKGSAAEAKYGWLYLPDKYKSAWIIDGQHRLYGFSFSDSKHMDDDIFVVAFEMMDRTKEADLFLTINSQQKRVPQSIIVALQSDLKWGSEDAKDRLGAIRSALAKVLNADPASALFGKLVVEGLRHGGRQPLTMPEVSKGLDRAKLVGRLLHDQIVSGPLSGRTDEETIRRSKKVINGYLAMVSGANEVRWERGKDGFMCTNPGVRAYFLLLAEILKYVEVKEGFEADSESEDAILEVLRRMLAPICDFIRVARDQDFSTRFSRKFGEGGVREYFFNLCEIMEGGYPDFGSDEYRTFVKQKNDDRLQQAHYDVIQLNALIMDYVHQKLRTVHGEQLLPSGKQAYWAYGVQKKDYKTKAYGRMQADPAEQRKEMFAYLDILDIQGIVKQKNNWEHFRDVFHLRMPGENKGNAYHLKWLEEFNELRRVSAHSSSMRFYDEKQYEFLAWLDMELKPRLRVAQKELKKHQSLKKL